MAMAAWAFANGASLLLTANAFSLTPVYRYLAEWPVHEDVWAVGFLVYAGVTVAVLRAGTYGYRAAVSLMGAPFWLLHGGFLLIGAYQVGLYSVAGIFEVLLAAGSIVSAMQWGGRDV